MPDFMLPEGDNKANNQQFSGEMVRQIFDDFEAKSNIVGLYDLLLKIDRRVNPHFYSLNQDQND